MGAEERISALEAKVAELAAKVSELIAIVAARDLRIAELEKLLEEQRRSSKRQAAPFSKGEPKDEPARPGRKKGRNHGNHGHRLAPVAEPDRTLDAPAPEACPGCGGATELERIATQFQTELPEPRPSTTKFNVEVRRCRSCGKRVQGWHPEQVSDALGAAGAQVGPRAMAWATWMHYSLGLSFGKCAQVLARLGVGVTPGAICHAASATSTDLVPTHEAIKDHVAAAPALTMDETGWRIGGEGAWLWVAATDDATLYDVARGRGFEQAKGLVPGDYAGTIVRDGWVVYNSYDKATHQSCIAHLLRRCHEMGQDLPAWARSTPRQVADLLHEALDARDLDATARAAAVADIGERLDLLCDEAQPHDANRRLVKHLRHERDALFSFLTIDGVDATNWRGEQGVRPAVVNRKVWGGNRTEQGAQTQGRVMTFLRTAHQQGADAIALLVDLARAPSPGVVPGLMLRSG